jgi:hypothetical protein
VQGTLGKLGMLGIDQRLVRIFLREQSKLRSHAVEPVLLEQVREAVERGRGTLDCAIDVPIEQREHRFGQPGEVPRASPRPAVACREYLGASGAACDAPDHLADRRGWNQGALG